ncbi:ABC-type glutathione transport system ATPase component [Arthrobacter bambusae]|uniref:ABC-type glutathione transport system ATPase component n=1 Tax=Arthrobacter bambusae TaxID=1338426 RepID=A0ABV2P1F6_9MICC
MSESQNVIEIKDLDVRYGWGRHSVQVLHGVSLNVAAGCTVGVVGESGSGKSTLAKTLVGTLKPTRGTVMIDGVNVSSVRGADRLKLRRKVLQMIPQDPFSSLNPRHTIGQALAEALDPRHADVKKHRSVIAEWLERVKMPAEAMSRYPHEFSGGQRQRVAIARGLIPEPTVVIADEITSALDVSVQAEILSLIAGLRQELNLTMVFISHNLAVVRQVSDEVAVMYQGKVVEHSPTAELFNNPQHPYTQSLLRAVPGTPGFSIDPGITEHISHENRAIA